LRQIAFILSLLAIFSNVTAYSQSDPCDLQFRDQTGMRNTRLLAVHQDLVLVTDRDAYKIINVDKFAKIRFDNGTYIWTGIAVGAAVGFISGYLLYDMLGKKAKSFLGKDPNVGVILILTLPCAFIGGVVGSLYKNIDMYDIEKLNSYNKAKEIKWIMKYHSKWR
jgi:hypothetical protein